MKKSGNVMVCCTHPNVINHTICTKGEVTLGLVCALSLNSTKQFILPKQFFLQKNHKKI